MVDGPENEKKNCVSLVKIMTVTRDLIQNMNRGQLLSTGPSGLILSTDDFFAHREGYNYEARLLGEAHDWNHNRTQDAMHDGRSPIIIDNTNAQAWEMKPYVKMALDRGYKVDFCEPDTSWKFDPFELEKYEFLIIILYLHTIADF
ncbi:NEDD4-binding protein 2-like 2 [Dissostichus eleginoides]|uniref:NEDD4-binding protein 2-like 2 n=1 Tax=Dissostichus eleginoides TaxID=100907 RepID=A0AAD9CD18_DISEL|nr:NEDD4-binding protein 2-like 2 [Dissostichus eleginoides]